MFVDLDLPLNASSLLSASAELLVTLGEVMHAIVMDKFCVFFLSDLLAEYRKSGSVEDVEKLKIAICTGEHDICV